MAAGSRPKSWLWWWLICVLTGCVQPGDHYVAGAFGRTQEDLRGQGRDMQGRDKQGPDKLTAARDSSGGLLRDSAASGRGAQANKPDSAVTNSAAGNWVAGSWTSGRPAAEDPAGGHPAGGHPAGGHPAGGSDSGHPGLGESPAPISGQPEQPSLAQRAAVAAGVAVPTQEQRGERELRNAFANAIDPTEAALDLAGFLVTAERYDEALFVVDLALKRKRTVPLRLARAGLLRDLANCDQAALELQSVVRELGIDKVAPVTLFGLAQVEWVAGQGEAASATLDSLMQVHAGDSWLLAHADELARWHDRMATTSPNRDRLANGELRDLFALLRAAPLVRGRLQLLAALAKPTSRDATDERRPVRMRAIAIACADESAAVRTRAVQLADANKLIDLSFWSAALADEAALVRRFAARGAVHQHGEDASPLLLAAIEQEADGNAFAEMHTALAVALAVVAPACDATTNTGRTAALDQWRALAAKTKPCK